MIVRVEVGNSSGRRKRRGWIGWNMHSEKKAVVQLFEFELNGLLVHAVLVRRMCCW